MQRYELFLHPPNIFATFFHENTKNFSTDDRHQLKASLYLIIYTRAIEAQLLFSWPVQETAGIRHYQDGKACDEVLP